MPHIGRTAQRKYAKELREVGELVTVLIDPNAGSTSTAIPYDAVAGNESIDITTAKKVQLYAKVAFHKLADVKFEEAGKAVFSEITVTTTSQLSIYLQQCFAVQLSDGSVLRKNSENIGETRAVYTIICSGYINVNQTL
jgi:hypothetical protein